MTIGLLILIGIPALIIILTLVGWAQYVHAQMKRHGHIPVLWRWFSGGLPHSVRNEQDRRYRAMYDPSSQHYHIKARMHRALVRTCSTFLPFVLPPAILLHVALAWYLVFVFGGALIGEAMWKGYRAEKVRHNRRTIRHVGRAAAPFANQPVRGRTSQWIRFVDKEGKPDKEGKRQRIRVDLPKNWNPSQQNRDRLKQVVFETVGFHPGSEADFKLEGDDNYVIFTNRQAPPDRVELTDIAQYVDKNGPDKITLGLGRGNDPVDVSLKEDSPHIGMSVGSGGGKSQLARLAAAQVLHNGGNVLFLDPKRISHAWARDLPNVRYARTTKEIHDALMWLDFEVNRRTNVADVGANVEGEVLANVGPRLLVVAEELNELTQRLRTYWNDNRPAKGVKKSPAITALESALFMGRQVKINIIAVAQMMTALAAGSGAARENMGVRILGRYTKNNWRMLVPEFDMPGRSMRPGRMQVVTEKIREVQVAFITGMEAHDFALSGRVTAFPEDLVNVPEPVKPTTGEPDAIEGEIVEETIIPALDSHDPHPSSADEDDPRTKKVTLIEAAPCIGRSVKSLENAKYRDKTFPKSIGKRDAQGYPREYWLSDIIEWNKRRRGEPV